MQKMESLRASSCSSRTEKIALARSPLLLFSLLLFCYTLTLGGHLYAPDDEIVFRVTESIAQRGSLAVKPIIDPRTGDGFSTRPPAEPRPDGREYAQYGVGLSLAAMPFYYGGLGLRAALGPWVDDDDWWLLAGRLRAEGFIYDAQGIDPEIPLSFEMLAPLAEGVAARLGVSLLNIFVTAFSGVVLFLTLRRLCGDDERPAWMATLLWGLGSIAWAHSRSFFSEPLAGLCLLTSLYMLARVFIQEGSPAADSESKKSVWPLPLLAGMAIAYGCLTRLDSILFLPTLCLLVVWGDFSLDDGSAGNNEKGLWERAVAHPFQPGLAPIRRLVLFLLPVALAGGIILGLNYREYGSLFASGYSDQKEGINFSTPILIGLHGFLMSTGKGMFFFSPALVVAFWGFRPMLKRQPIFGGAILLLFATFLCVMAKWQNWTGGWCWGPRHIVQIHGLLAIPAAFWLAERWNAPRRSIATALLIIGGAVQLYGSSQSFFEFYYIYYRSPEKPNSRLQYAPGDILPEGLRSRSPGWRSPAPINDSIYIVQNSQWMGNRELWSERGIHDFFWPRLFE